MKTCAHSMVWILALLASGIIGSSLFGLVVEAAPPGQGGPAKIYGGVTFRLGDLSFADEYARFNPAPATTGDHANPAHALRPPDYVSFSALNDTGYVSLGDAEPNQPHGQLVLEFIDNALVDGPGDDLAIFEIGPKGESADVYVSATGHDDDWIYVGQAPGGTSTLDLSGSGAVAGVQYRFVLLCDVVNGNSDSKSRQHGWAGPDIDAVGTVNSVAVAESCSIMFRCMPFRDDEQGVRHVTAGKSIGCWVEYSNPDRQDVQVSVRVNDESLLSTSHTTRDAVEVTWGPQQTGPYLMRAWVKYPDGRICRASQTIIVDPGL